MRRSEAERLRRELRLTYSKLPQFSRLAFEAANLMKLPQDVLHWPQGTVFALTKIALEQPKLALRLGREPTVGELAAEYCRLRALEISVACASLDPGTSDIRQSGPMPGNLPSNQSLDPGHAEPTQEGLT